MSELSKTKLSVLDLSPIPDGSEAADALRNSLDLAQHAEAWGYNRYWVAEHHNMPGIASSATSVVIGYIAGGTSTIRVGSGGVMLPNHSPLVIAEHFGTLATLYPGRIDLGLGRAPGTDPVTAHALRRDQGRASDTFPQDVQSLINYFGEPVAGQKVRAMPGEGTKVPIWLLGSSLFSAELAAKLGLPYSFASHFTPTLMLQAVKLYRDRFEPSEFLERPYLMLGLPVVAAETDREAQYLFTTQMQHFTNLRRGTPGKMPPPVESMDGLWTIYEEDNALRTFEYAVVGSRQSVQTGLQWFLNETDADELLITSNIYEHRARLRSYQLVSEIKHSLDASTPQLAQAAA